MCRRIRVGTTVGLLLLLMAPLAIVWVFKEVANPRPHWFQYYDPELAYYHSGLELLHGRSVSHIHHPGTPVQMLAAAGIALTGDSVARIPNALFATRLLAFLLIPVAMLLLLATLFRGLPWYLAVPGIWSFYLSGQSLRYLNLVTPESLYFLVTSVFAASVWWVTRRGADTLGALLAGGALGLCLSVKFLFIAWVPAFIAWLLLSARQARLTRRVQIPVWGMLGVVLGFLMSTMVVFDRYPEMFSWVVSLGTREGNYGSGSTSLPDPEVMAQNLVTALLSAKVWYLWLFTWVALFGIALRVRTRTGGVSDKGEWALFVFLLLALAGSHLLLARGFGIRYLMPMAALGVIAFAVVMHTTSWFHQGPWRWMPLVIVIPLLGKHVVQEYREHQGIVEAASHVEARIAAVVDNHKMGHTNERSPVVIYSFRTPVRAFADRIFAPAWRQEILDEAYPSEGHHTPWYGELRLPGDHSMWDLLVIRRHDLNAISNLKVVELAQAGEFVIVENVDRRDNR